MKQTPIHDNFNADLLAMMPAGARRIVEVGCSGGALAREYRKANPRCEYIGIEIDEGYAAIARDRCTRVLSGSIEQLPDPDFDSLTPADCWVFGDVLEHLYDPWAVLRRLRRAATPETSIVACIPNAQHWSVQLRLNSGLFRYEDAGLLDRTHIRWFTRRTIAELFASTGFRIVEGSGRTFDEPHRERGLAAVRAMAAAIGADVEACVQDAAPLQWLVRAVPGGEGAGS